MNIRMMRLAPAGIEVLCTLMSFALPGLGRASAPPSISQVEIRERAFYVNGQPFFPLMSWLQDARNFEVVKAAGMNATAGYTAGAGRKSNLAAYMEQAAEAGLYGVMPFDVQLKGHPFVLGYIHGDEPDLAHPVNDARVVADPSLRLNPRNPLWKLVDGDPSSWSVLDPLENASFTIHLPNPVTVESLGLAVTISKGLALPKTVAFLAAGRELLKTDLAPKPGLQQFPLAQPATFKDLTIRILAITQGDQAWGSLGEVTGLDAAGRNVLLAPIRKEPQAWPEQTLAEYRGIKAGDSSRPVFMTLTGNFHPFFKYWPEKNYALYPAYIAATDVVGYDIYPIYGWNKPEWIHLGHEATDRLVKMAAHRPVYAWIETSKGGQWTGPLEGQKEVTGEHIKAEVWMCICRGATAIGYFTHIWKPSYAQFGVPEANRLALRQINEQITRLARAILGQPREGLAAIQSPDGVKLDMMTREYDGALYLFAVNYDERLRAVTATIQVPHLAAGKPVSVVDEQREITAGEGRFADYFAPLAVHIYRITPPRPAAQ
jgi:hypothetical protein